MSSAALRRRAFGLAVAVLLCGMAYVTYDTQRDVQRGNDARAELQRTVAMLQRKVSALETDNARKDAEIRRLTALLVKNNIDPRPTPAAPLASNRPTSTPTSRSRPRASGPHAAPAPATPTPAPTPTPTRSPTPAPSPTPCLLHDPLSGRCLT